MATPTNVYLWLLDQSMPVVVILCATIFIMILLFVSARARRVAMRRRRAGVNEYTFVNYLATYGFDADIARMTYQYLQEKQNVHFPIEPHDQLDEDLGLDSSDIRQTVRELLAACDRQYSPGMMHTPLVTVEDLVRYLQASPRNTEVAA